MSARACWLLYDESDLALNRDYADFFAQTALRYGFAVTTVTREARAPVPDGRGGLLLPPERLQALPKPALVVSRQRDALLSHALERRGVPVYNASRVCALCNDKRETHRFLTARGLPMMPTQPIVPDSPPPRDYPLVVKPACGHGGDRVRLVDDADAWLSAVADILPQPAIMQPVAKGAGRDMRVYVLFGKIVAGVMRTAKQGIVSNFKRGGDVALHTPDEQERALVLRVLDAFEAEGAPLSYAGVDLLYDRAGVVVGEVEDVVGSRMLYRVGGPDITALYLEGLRERLG